MEIDFLIIGQGLAGSLLAWELIQRQKNVIIVDNNQPNASLVAAGLINPVTGMRFVKSANADQLLPVAIDCYQKLADFFNQTFYIKKTMLRLLRNNKEATACSKRFKDRDYRPYLDKIIPSHPDINTTFGLLRQKQTGYLLTIPLLTALKDYFISLGAYINAEINYDEIKLTPTLRWNSIQPKQIIFCEGHHAATANPWFSALPFQPVKGEIITATATAKVQQNILNYGHWFIPLNNSQFRTGASFDRDSLNTAITSEARDILLNSLKQIYPALTVEKINKQQAGIRPTTLDKMPFVGRHPKYSNFIIFNGFGAKGSLQIPWHSQNLANHLLNKKPLAQASSILRYYHLF